jgi:Polysaccharide lyase
MQKSSLSLAIACTLLCGACTTTVNSVEATAGASMGIADNTPLNFSGLVGNTLCVNARAIKNAASSITTYAHIEQFMGVGAVESPSDSVYTPTQPHVFEVADDGIVGAHFAMIAIEPTDVNQDMVTLANGGDRSRTEIKIAPSVGAAHDTFKAKEGETFSYAWRFRIAPEMKFSPSFTHIHQIKAHGGKFSDPPLITFTPLANGKMEVRYVGDKQTDAALSELLGAVSLANVQGAWIEAREKITFSNTQGHYALTLRNLKNETLLTIDKHDLTLWRTGANHMRPKWGIYRKHSAALNQNQTDTVYFANIAITRGNKPDSTCR